MRMSGLVDDESEQGAAVQVLTSELPTNESSQGRWKPATASAALPARRGKV